MEANRGGGAARAGTGDPRPVAAGGADELSSLASPAGAVADRDLRGSGAARRGGGEPIGRVRRGEGRRAPRGSGLPRRDAEPRQVGRRTPATRGLADSGAGS